MFFDLILSIIAIIAFLQTGLICDYYMIARRKLSFDLAIFLALGIGFVAVLQMVLGFLGIPINRLLVMILSLAAFLPYVFDRKLRRQVIEVILDYRNLSWGNHLLVILVFSVFAVIVGFLTFSHPVWGYDAIQRWLAKAYIFWVDGGINKTNIHIVLPSDDPNLWPLTVSWFYYFLGNASLFWVQVIPLTVFFCLAGKFWQIVKGSSFSRLWLIIFMFTPFLWQTVTLKAYSGNADLLVSFYLLLTLGSLFYRKLVYAAVFLGLGALTKNDVLPALVTFCILMPVFSLKSKQKFPKAAFISGWGLLLFNLGFKYYFSLGSRYLETNWNLTLRQRPIFEYTKYSLQAFREEFRQVSHWGIGFLVIGYFIVSRIGRVLKDKIFLFGAVLLLVQIVGYIWVYYVTKEDQATQIATSIYRLVLQIYPALLLLAFFLYSGVPKIGNRRK